MRVSILAILASASFASAQQFYTTQGLIEGIADNGTASGSDGGNGQYFMWTPSAGFQSIGGVTPGNGVGGQGKISRDGRYISGTTYNATNDWHEMSRYDAQTGQWTGFGSLPGIGTQIDAETSSGWAISGDGRHVVGLGWTSQGTADAYASQWSEGSGLRVVDNSPQVGDSSRANGVNYDGSVVVGWQDGNGRQGSVWVNGVQELIFDNGGNAAQEALAVSGDGTWVTGYGIGGFFGPPGEAYRYNTVTDTYETIPNLAVGGGRTMGATAITDDGSMIVGGTWPLGPAFFGSAFVWTEDAGTVSFTDFLDANGVAYPVGYNFAFASAMSSDGEWIAGWGDGGAGIESWVVHIPTPSSLVAVAFGGLVAARRRR